MTQKLGFIFPGQGAQKTGMLADLGDQFALVRETFQEASDVLGYDLWELVQSGTDEQLAQTEITQPAILTSSVAVWRLWQDANGIPAALAAGHSLGEYSALVCSGAIAFADAVDLVRKRGQFMQDAVPAGVGAMSAIVGLDDETIVDICAALSEDNQAMSVQAVNFNSPGQVVIAGHTELVKKAGNALLDAGARRALPLPVSAPFHSSLMKPAAEKFAQVIDKIEISTPEVPVIQNATLAATDKPDVIRENLIKQIYMPVPWVKTIQQFQAEGVEVLIEMGPGQVLAGLNKRIAKDLPVVSVNSPQSLEKALEMTLNK